MSRESVSRFVEYFSKPLNSEQLSYLNNLNGVITEEVELFNDFTISLCYLVCETYMGDDIMNREEKNGHFNWCWTKNIANFNKENINIFIKGEHRTYFLNYFDEVFYENDDKSNVLLTKITEFWNNIFSQNKNKTKSEYDLFIEIYKLMDRFLEKTLDI